MFDEAKKATNARGRREELESEVLDLVEKGRLFITDVLLEDEPWRTRVFEVWDGIVVEDGVPRSGGPGFAKADVRLVHVNDGGVISCQEVAQERVPGTRQLRKVDVEAKYGNDATLRHKNARQILWTQGWPFRNAFTNGRTEGTVVEWLWIESKAKEPDCDSATRELFAQIKARLERTAPTAPTSPKSKATATAA
jgi:hypothetical protein